MNIKDKFKNADLPPEEMDKVMQAFTKRKVAGELKSNYADKLAQQYGVTRRETRVASLPRRKQKTAARVPWRLMAIAASFLLVLSFWFTPFQSSQINPHASLAELELADEPHPMSLDRVLDDKSQELILPFLNAYAEGDFPRAVVRGEELQRQFGLQTIDRFFLGLSYLYSQDYAKATPMLAQTVTEIEGQTDFSFRDDTYWYYSLALLKENKVDMAIDQLQKISSTHDHYKKARELIRILQENE